MTNQYKVECLNDLLNGVSAHSITLYFTTEDFLDGPHLELDEIDLSQGEESVKNRLKEVFNDQDWYIEDADGIPTLFVDGEFQTEWTLEEICRFANQVTSFESQDEREAFLTYVSTVGIEWDIEQFEDKIFMGIVDSVEAASQFMMEDEIPEFVHRFVDWKNLWGAIADEDKLYLVKLTSGRYAIMSGDY